MTDRIGLMVARLQPLHRGHIKIINHMIQDCRVAIVAIGSAQESRTKHNPWTVEERMEMLKRIYGAYNNKGEYVGSRIKMLPLNDLGAADRNQWVGYIFDKVKNIGLSEPTDYYTGSEADAQWYKEHFWTDLFSSQWEGEEPPGSYYVKGGVLRRIHIVERNHNPVPAATEIRTWLETRTDGWKNWVPSINHQLVSKAYPEEFKIPVS